MFPLRAAPGGVLRRIRAALAPGGTYLMVEPRVAERVQDNAANPFARLHPPALEGRDLNPLLQDPGMVIHPPMLYMGYVGFSVAYAFAVAALLAGKGDLWDTGKVNSDQSIQVEYAGKPLGSRMRCWWRTIRAFCRCACWASATSRGSCTRSSATGRPTSTTTATTRPCCTAESR